jgi:hypothetical protein
MTEGATIEVARARTATGPTSETRAAVVESFVLRHEQDAFDAGFVGCIGHSCPSPCEQVHDCSAAVAVSPAQSDMDVSVNTDSWNTSHPPAIRARCFRTLRMAAQPSIPGLRSEEAARFVGHRACHARVESGSVSRITSGESVDLQTGGPPGHGDGTFDVDGTYRLEVGPASIDPAPPGHFSGSVSGSTLILNVLPSVGSLRPAS